jgi:type III pantothenate kinase
MLLAIDAGNTNIVFAACDGDNIVAQWRAATKTIRTADEYGGSARASGHEALRSR